MSIKFNRGNYKITDNRGSTLITVLVAVAFIAILGTVSASVAMVNYKMKVVDKKSKNTFYTAEEAVDEIYTGLGITSMECLDKAYREEMAKLIQQKSDTGDSYRGDNTEANLNMRKMFTKSFLCAVFNKDENTDSEIWNYEEMKIYSEDSYKESLKNQLTSYLSTSGKASVKSVGNVELAKSVSKTNGIAIYTVTMKDCVVEYIKDSEGYYAEVSFDCVTQLPDTMVNFTNGSTASAMDNLNSYHVLGYSGIRVEEGKKVTIKNASAFAGGGSVSEYSTGGFNLQKNSLLTVQDSTIVTSGDITIDSAGFTADAASSGGTRIWSKNMIVKNTGKDVSPKVTINNCNTYVKDDLQIDGSGTNAANPIDVSISGEYYGYGYEGNNSKNSHNASSCMAVNGTNAELDISGITSLMLGGRAYVDFNESETYMTGQSMALKGDQEVYLVPSSLLKEKSDLSKSLSNPFEESLDCVVEPQKFFGYTCLDLSDTANNSFIRKVKNGNSYYVYFVFASKDKASKYFKAILNDSVYEELVKAGGADKDSDLRADYDATRAYMRNIIENNMAALSQSVISSSGADIYTNGALISADLTTGKVTSPSSSDNFSVSGYGSYDGFGLNAIDLSNRYTYLCKLLYEPDWNKEDGSRNIQFSTGQLSLLGAEGNAFENVVNTAYIEKQKNLGKLYAANVSGGYVKLITDKDAVITSNMKYGVVVALGDIKVETDEFHGLIIANGNVVFKNDSTVVDGEIPGSSTVEEFIQSDPDFAMYFKKYNTSEYTGESGVPLSIGQVTYKDIVGIQNWRKN